MTQGAGATPQEPMAAKARDAVIVLALVGLTAWIYTQTAFHQFLIYDDSTYVTQNPQVLQGLTASSVRWAFTTGAAANWHPLTWISHLLDVQLFGLNPMGHHAVSVIIHALDGVLLYFALKRLTRAPWPSAFTAALFLVHPLHVESVAWIAERKDVLSSFFGFAALLAYARYAERPHPGRYCVVAVLFGLGLLAKPMLVTLPLVMLLLDYWPLERMTRATFGRLTLEKAPLLLLSILSSVVTFIVQRSGEAVKSFETFPWTIRLENAVLAYARYLGKALWPTNLSVFYPHPGATISTVATAAAFALLLAITLALWQLRGRNYLLVGWLWYLGTLVPVIGLVQVGTQAMADRYTYIPMVGVFIMVAWEMARQSARGPVARAIVVGAGALAIIVLSAVAWRQIGYWHDSIRLFTHAASCTRDNTVAYGNLAQAELDRGNVAEAEKYTNLLLAVTPNDADALSLAGVIQTRRGDFSRAVEYLTRSLAINPGNARAHNNIAGALANLGRLDEAIAHLEEALRIAPHYEAAQKNLDSFREFKAKQDVR